MNKKPLSIPKIIILYLLPFFNPIIIPIIAVYTFTRLNRKRTGWLFSGAEVLVFILSAILFYIIKTNHEDFLHYYALLLLLGPVLLIHLVSFYLTISLYKRITAQNR